MTQPTPEQRDLQVGLEVQGAVVPGPDGRAWGAIHFTVFNSAWRVVLPPEILAEAIQLVTSKMAETLELVRQHNGETLAVPVTQLILPPDVQR